MTDNSDDLLPSQKSVKTYVDQSITGLIDSAPITLNTLNKLSSAIANDSDFSHTVSDELNNRVDKVTGMGLSTNDYTTDEKIN